MSTLQETPAVVRSLVGCQLNACSLRLTYLALLLSLPSLLLQTSSQQKTKSIFAEETLTSHRIIGICRSLNGDGRRGRLVGKQISTLVRREEVDFTCGDPTGTKSARLQVVTVVHV